MILNKEMQEAYQPLVPFMPEEPKVGYGYVPYQVSPEFLDVDTGFMEGSLFHELVTPYSQFLGKEVQDTIYV